MTLLQFLALWANPTNTIKLYAERDFKKAAELVNAGMRWNEISENLKSLLIFNPKYALDIPGCFLPQKQVNSEVARFVVVEDGLLVFLKI